MTTLRALIAAGLVVGMFGWAVAKLPSPPPMDEKAKAAAEEKKAKDTAAAEAAKALQARTEDRVVHVGEQNRQAHAWPDQLAQGRRADRLLDRFGHEIDPGAERRQLPRLHGLPQVALRHRDVEGSGPPVEGPGWHAPTVP